MEALVYVEHAIHRNWHLIYTYILIGINSCPIYCNSSDIGAVSGYGAESGSTGITYMVITGRYGVLG